MSNNLLEVGKDEAKLDLVMDDLKQNKDVFCFEEIKSSTQKKGSKVDENVIPDEIVIDNLDFTVLKKKMKNDQLETECHVEEIKGQTERGIEKNHQDYKKMLQCGKESDVTFFVRGEEFKGHRSIFKEQCTIFASMLQEEIVKTSGLVVIDGSDPNLFATIFQNLYTGYMEMLTTSGLVVIDNSDPNLFAIFHQYLYTGHVKTLTTENVFGLYSIARKYGAQKLETECVQYMKSILSLDTICDILTFSFQDQKVELVELASDFFSRNVSEIVTTSKWQVFKKENCTAANELLVKVNKRGFSQFSKSDFQTMSKIELQHRAGPSDLDSRKPNGTRELLTYKELGELSIGELSVEAYPSKEIKWKIPGFLALTEEIDYWIYSPLFSLANSTWCLRMFPNGRKKENTDGWIDLLLVRLYSQDSDNLVWYKLGIMTCDNKIYVSSKDSNIFKESNVEWGVAHLLERSETVDIAKDGIVTVCCDIQVAENRASNHLKLCKLSMNSPLLKMPEKLKIGELSEEFFLTKVISWKVLDPFALLEEREYYSPSFNFENAFWCLQMYLIDEKTRGDGALFGLKLVRLHSNILKHEIYFTLGIKNHLGQICSTFSDKYIFGEKTVKWKDVCFLKQSIKEKCTTTASKTCVTAFCEMFVKENQKISPEPPQKFQSNEIRDLPSCAHSTEFTWKITKCFDLPVNEGYFINSTKFSFANATWCLRVYPNGKKGDSTGSMHLLLVRLSSCNLEHIIHYRLGLKKRSDKKYGSFTHVVTFHANAVEMGIISLLSRSNIIKKRKLYAQDDILTAFCEIFIMEEVKVLFNDSQLFKPSSEFQSLERSKTTQQLPVESTLFDPEIYIWKITNFFKLPLDENYFIDSSEFSFANATWCMRMYPNGHRGGSSGWIHLMLVRLYSCNSEHRIHYRLGLKIRRNKELGTLTHVATFHTNTKEIGVVNLLKRSTINNMTKMFVLEGNLTAFCHISLIEKTIALSNETNSSKSQSVDILEHTQHLYLKSTLSNHENLTWEVTNFFELPMYEGYCVESAEFSFANATWCLRMYPNGQKGVSSGYIQLLLMRLHHSINSEHRIQYRLGLITRRDKEHGSKLQTVTFRSNAVEMGIVNVMKRSDMNSKKMLLKNGILTVFCKIFMIEEILLSNQTEVMEASSGTELVMDNVIDYKQDQNNTSSFGKLKSNIQEQKVKTNQLETELSNFQKIGSKEDEIIIDDLDFTVLKKKKKKKKMRNDQLETECHVEEIKGQKEIGTELVMDTVIDYKQDKNNTSSFGELKSNIKEISSEDDGKVIRKTSDELEKKKMSNDQFEMEKREAELAVNKSQQDYKKMLQSEKECDVTFFVRGEEFEGHSAIFKEQSTFFATMSQEDIVKTSGLIVVDDSDPCFFAIFLQYLCTGHVETLTRDNVCCLYTLAQKYGAQKLLTECVQYMKNVLTLDTSCDN